MPACSFILEIFCIGFCRIVVDPSIFCPPPPPDEGWEGTLMTMAIALVLAPGAVKVLKIQQSTFKVSKGVAPAALVAEGEMP
jgi:hypothetical protein